MTSERPHLVEQNALREFPVRCAVLKHACGRRHIAEYGKQDSVALHASDGADQPVSGVLQSNMSGEVFGHAERVHESRLWPQCCAHLGPRAGRKCEAPSLVHFWLCGKDYYRRPRENTDALSSHLDSDEQHNERGDQRQHAIYFIALGDHVEHDGIPVIPGSIAVSHGSTLGQQQPLGALS